VRRAIENRFSFVGTVDAIGDATWVISGRAVGLTAETVVAAGIEVGDVVKVEGRLASDGTLQAASISPADEAGLAFSFVGVIESIAEDEWIISGKAVSVGPESEVEEGLAAGEVVAVSGQILEDGTWAADSIARVEAAEARFEFSGVVESMDPWLVSGVSLETADWTEVDAGLQEGDRVKVEGRILEDGTWLAEEIKLLDPDKPLKFEFVGRVSSLDPWVVAGIDLAVDEETEIEADIAVGDTVKAEGRILEDGSWLAGEIKLVVASLGCVTTVEIIQLVDGEQIILLDGQTLTPSEASDVEGDIQIASVISITTCTDADGQVIVVSIIVLFQLEELPTPAPSGEGEKVTLCHKVGGKGGGHTLTVSQSAVPAHLAHGDTLGACP